MNLLLDIGNTRCKWALTIPHARAEPVSFGYLAPDANLDEQLQHIEHISGVPQRAMVANVGSGKIADTLRTAISARWPQMQIHHFKTTARAFGITNAYAQPETLGVDRWAALIAAHAVLPMNAVIVDCGTAVTIDVLNAQGLHLGGYILPGLYMMREALYRGTAGLPLAEGQSMVLAKTTNNAIVSGTLLSLAATIEAVVRTQSEHQRSKYECLLTGGDAELIGKQLTISCRYEPDLVLKGLAIAIDAESEAVN